MKIFYLNIDSDVSRRQHIDAQLRQTGLKAQRISAVRGMNLPFRLRSYFFNREGELASQLKTGEVGCYASHMLAWEAVKDEGHPYALVLEDDADLEPNIRARLIDILDTAPADWEFIHICNTPDRAVKNLQALETGGHLVRYSRIPNGTMGYLISNAGAHKMLIERRRCYPVDTDLRCPWFFKLNVYGVVPPVLHQSSAFGSSLGARSRLRRGLRVSNPLHSWRGPLFNIRKLTVQGWVVCFIENVGRRLLRDYRRLQARLLTGKHHLGAVYRYFRMGRQAADYRLALRRLRWERTQVSPHKHG